MRPGFVWLAGFRDLQWRRRRFVIAVLGTALVMALTLMLTGFQAVFDLEIRHTLKLIDADGYLVSKGRTGPFLGGTPLPQAVAESTAQIPGVTDISPLIMTPQVTDQKQHADVFLIAATPTRRSSFSIAAANAGTSDPGHTTVRRAARCPAKWALVRTSRRPSSRLSASDSAG